MTSTCFQCDKDLVPRAKFCHQCGAPTFLADEAPVAAQSTSEARARVKQDVHGAAQIPTSTRMLQTVLVPRMPKPKPPPPIPPAWQRFVQAPLWRKSPVWIGLGLVAAVAAGVALIGDVQDKLAQQSGQYQIVTRLTSRCYKDSRTAIDAYVARIQKASGGQETLLDSAVLFEYVVRGVAVPQGDCSKIAEALARPNRFEPLLQPTPPR